MPTPTAILPDGFVRTIRNPSTTTPIAAHVIVKLSAAGDPPSGIVPAASDDAIYGVTLEEIPALGYGSVQIHGKAKVRLGANVTALARLMPATTTGRAITLAASAGTNVSMLGQAMAGGAADDVIEVELSGPGVSRQG